MAQANKQGKPQNQLCMKKTNLIAGIVCIVLIQSCTGSMNTFSDYDKKADLSIYRTYAWLSPGDSLNPNPVNQQIELMYSKSIMYAANNNLNKKGMILSPENPDVVFKFSLGVDRKTNYSQSPTLSVGVAVGGMGYYAGPGYYGAVSVPVAGGSVSKKYVDEAFIYIQMFETKSGALLWTGGVRKTVENSADSQKNIQLAMNAVFADLKIRHKAK
jgi:hypothetical protein